MKAATKLVSLVLPALIALAGCSAYPNTKADFGNSVRQMVRAQTSESGPVDSSPVETGDGQRLENVLKALRSDVTRGDDGAQGNTGFENGASQLGSQ
jgi:hypothetical protein